MKVFVSEDHGEAMFGWSGRFSASLQGDGVLHDGPQGVPVDEAIAWGREHADVVLVMSGDDDRWYSAGRERPPDVPPWPEGRAFEPRRDPRHAYLDRTPEDPPIAWRVDTDEGDYEVHARTWDEAVKLAEILVEQRRAKPRTSYAGFKVRPAGAD